MIISGLSVPVHSGPCAELLNRPAQGKSALCGLVGAESMSLKILLLIALMAPILLIALGALIHGSDGTPRPTEQD